MATRDPGRPREFDRDRALRAAMEMFWRRGYAATSLDDLLQATGIGRSSFYGAFGSKHALMIETLTLYTDELHARLLAAAASTTDPEVALLAVMDIAACTDRPHDGCFFINSVAELMPTDAAVRTLARRHLGRVDRLLVGLLQRGASRTPTDARDLSGTLLALAAGAVALRKAGEPTSRITALLARVPSMLNG